MKKDFKTLRVLVVDDEPLILMSLARFLKKRALVKTVLTPEKALDAIREQHYDLCFLDVKLDVKLPGMTGLDVMKIINELYPNTKVAIMTGILLDKTMKEQVDEYAYKFIKKPFGLSDIEGVVQGVTAALNQ